MEASSEDYSNHRNDRVDDRRGERVPWPEGGDHRAAGCAAALGAGSLKFGFRFSLSGDGGASNGLGPSPAWKENFDRWVDLNEMGYSMRYRSVFDLNNAHEFNQGQERGVIDLKFKSDGAGKHGIAMHATSGKYFNWAYADFMGGGNQQAFLLEKAKASRTEQIKFGRAASFDAANNLASQSSGGWSFYVRGLSVDANP